MTELERRLAALADDYPFPPTPPLARAAARRLDVPAPGPRRRLALAAAVVALGAAAVLAFSSGARSAVLDWLDALPGVRIERVEELPSSRPLNGFDAGRPAELEEARTATRLRLPAGLGDPDRVYLDRTAGGGPIVTAEWGTRLVLTQWPAHAVLFHKLAVAGTRVDSVRVAGAPGAWISGGEHAVFYVGRAGGEEQRQPGRLAGNVLVWTSGGTAYRLEADVPLERALELAESLGP